jgi:hypothetical protein
MAVSSSLEEHGPVEVVSKTTIWASSVVAGVLLPPQTQLLIHYS